MLLFQFFIHPLNVNLCNSKQGAAAGMITSHIITGTFTIGSYIVDLPSQVLSTSTEVSEITLLILLCRIPDTKVECISLMND